MPLNGSFGTSAGEVTIARATLAKAKPVGATALAFESLDRGCAAIVAAAATADCASVAGASLGDKFPNIS